MQSYHHLWASQERRISTFKAESDYIFLSFAVIVADGTCGPESFVLWIMVLAKEGLIFFFPMCKKSISQFLKNLNPHVNPSTYLHFADFFFTNYNDSGFQSSLCNICYIKVYTKRIYYQEFKEMLYKCTYVHTFISSDAWIASGHFICLLAPKLILLWLRSQFITVCYAVYELGQCPRNGGWNHLVCTSSSCNSWQHKVSMAFHYTFANRSENGNKPLCKLKALLN